MIITAAAPAVQQLAAPASTPVPWWVVVIIWVLVVLVGLYMLAMYRRKKRNHGL